MARIFLGFHRGVLDLRFGGENLAALKNLGEVVLNLEDRGLTPEELIEQAGDCDIIVADRLTPGNGKFFDHAPKLVAYVRAVTDMKGIDVEAASRSGILVAAAGATFVPGVTEWIVGQMINLSRHFVEYITVYRSGVVPDIARGPKGRQLAEKTAGIIGFGKLGRNLGTVLDVLGMRVLASDPYVDDWPENAEPVELDDLLMNSDFVICLTNLTDETEGFMNAEVFGNMRPSAFFINAGRGALVDEMALEEALVQGQIAGAAMDVGSGAGDTPPLRLACLPNVLATPHIAPSMDANHAQGRQAVEMVATVLKGEPPEEALNAHAATRLKQFPSSTPASPQGSGTDAD